MNTLDRLIFGHASRSGRVSLLLLWLLGVPVPILLLLWLMR